MRIWHQSLTVLEDVPDYAKHLRAHVQRVARPDTEVVLHGLAPGTYPANYPGDDIAHELFFRLHGLQFVAAARTAQAEGYDAFAMGTLPDPMLREIRALVDIPVIGGGEVCFSITRTLGPRFGMLLFIDRMATRYLEQIAELDLAERCVGVTPVGFGFRDVMAGFDDPGPVVDRFNAAARTMIAQGADVIIPGEIPLNVLLAHAGVTRVDDVPVLDSIGVIVKMAETMVDLRRLTGLAPSRRGWTHARPRPERVEEVFRYYRLDQFPGER